MTGDEAHGAPWLAGYLGAVLAASMTLAAGFAIQNMGSDIGMLPAVMFVVTAVTFFTAWLPALIAHRLARRFCIRSVWYYLASGGLTGLLLCPVAVYLIESDAEYLPASAYLIQIMRLAPIMMPGGIVGALVFWSTVGRFNPATASPAATP